MNTDSIIFSKQVFAHLVESAKRYLEQPQSQKEDPSVTPSTPTPPTTTTQPAATKKGDPPGCLSVMWHEKTGLIVSEKPDQPGVYEIYVPDTPATTGKGAVKLEYSNRSNIPVDGEYECYAVGDLLMFSKNVTQPDSSVIKVQTFKVRYYSKTPDRFKNYVDNTIRMYNQQQSS